MPTQSGFYWFEGTWICPCHHKRVAVKIPVHYTVGDIYPIMLVGSDSSCMAEDVLMEGTWTLLGKGEDPCMPDWQQV